MFLSAMCAIAFMPFAIDTVMIERFSPDSLLSMYEKVMVSLLTESKSDESSRSTPFCSSMYMIDGALALSKRTLMLSFSASVVVMLISIAVS